MEPTQSIEQVGEKRTPLFVRETWWPGPIFLCAFLSVIAFLYLLVFVVPRFEEIYVSLGGQIPFATQVMVILSRVTLRYAAILVLPQFILLLYYALVLDRARRASKDKGFWRRLVLLICLGGITVFILSVFALYLPIFRIGM